VIDHSNKRYDIVPFIGGLLCVAGGDALGRKKVGSQDQALDDLIE
jgi:hypothetical protein